MSCFRAACLGIVVALLAAPAVAQSAPQWELLNRPGAIAMMRHALAPGTGDPANFRLDDCSTQRNLNDRGRAQARAIGDAFRANGVAVDRVLTSAWCRAEETARLLDLAPVETFAPLNSFFRDRSGRDRQTEETRAFLAGLADDVVPVLVTHQVNITALTGRFASSGEIVAITVSPDGTVKVLGEIAVDD